MSLKKKKKKKKQKDFFLERHIWVSSIISYLNTNNFMECVKVMNFVIFSMQHNRKQCIMLIWGWGNLIILNLPSRFYMSTQKYAKEK